MSTTSDVLSQITSALSDAAPYAGAISALANLGIDITKLIDPTQNYDQTYQDRCRKAADLISALVENPGVATERALSTFDDELLVATGRPVVGGISTSQVAIRVDRLLNHLADSAELAFYRALFAQLQQAGKPSQSASQQVGNSPEAKL